MPPPPPAVGNDFENFTHSLVVEDSPPEEGLHTDIVATPRSAEIPSRLAEIPPRLADGSATVGRRFRHGWQTERQECPGKIVENVRFLAKIPSE
jgi:hypothetical protein